MYIPYTVAWGKVIRQDASPADKYSDVWGEVKTYYDPQTDGGWGGEAWGDDSWGNLSWGKSPW